MLENIRPKNIIAKKIPTLRPHERSFSGKAAGGGTTLPFQLELLILDVSSFSRG
jgi:hypothetical protein